MSNRATKLASRMRARVGWNMTKSLLICAVVCLCASALVAQMTTGSITGTVTDPQGAVVPGANVRVVSQSTGIARQQVTDQTGHFTLSGLPPDTYTLSAEHAGFKRYERRDVVLEPNDRLSAGELQLAVGEASESVEVRAEGASVQVASSERSGIITSQQVENLTVINRDFSVLASLQPGVVYTPGAEAQSFSGNSQFNVNGSRVGQNNITIDGMPIENSNGTNFNTFISMDAISQVKVQSSLYAAEFGRKSGAAVQAVTKSGTAQYHGSLYWYQRNNAFNASQSFAKTNHLADPAYRFITGGGNVGGPVYIPKLLSHEQRKLFFFASEEQQREVRPQDLQKVTVPTLLERAGDFTHSGPGGTALAITDPQLAAKGLTCKKVGDPGCFPGSLVPAGRLDARMQKYLNLFPLPNVAGSNYNYQVQESLQIPKHTETLRMDYYATPNTTFYGVLNRWWDDEQGFAVPAANAKWGWLPSEYNPIARTITLAGTHMFNPTMIFEGTLLGSRWTEGNHPKQQYLDARNRGLTGVTLPQLDPQNNPLNLVPQTTYGGITNAANPTYEARFPISGTEDIFSFNGILTKVKGVHTFKTGFYSEYWEQVKGKNGNFAGTYDFSSNNSNFTAALGNTGYAYANALLGDFSSYTESTTRPPLISHYTGLEWFGQDNWKARRNLTLDIGLRLGWSRPFHNAPGDEAGFVPELYSAAQRVKLYGSSSLPAPYNQNPAPNGALVGAVIPGSGNPVNGTVDNLTDPNYPPGLRNSGHVGFAPRLGFAWDPFSNGRTAVRGGFGMFYDYRERDNFFTNDFKNPPIQFNPVIEFSQIPSVNPALLNQYVFPSSTTGFQRNRQVPYTMEYSLGIQREIGFKTMMDVAYVGSVARHLLWKMNLNAVPAGATLAANAKGVPNAFLRQYIGYGDITQWQYGGTSNYNSLQVAVNRRYAHGLNFGVAYTWSKAMDFADTENSEVINPSVFNVNFRQWQYGRAGYDRSQVLKASFIWDIPRASWGNTFARTVLDGWSISGVTSYQTGAPMGVSLNNVCVLPAGSLVSAFPAATSCPSGSSSNSGTSWSGSSTQAGHVVVLPGAANNVTTGFAHASGLNGFTLAPPPQGVVNAGPRNYFVGPGLKNWDMALFKQFPLHGERVKLQFRAEAYDIFNTTNFTTVDTNAQFLVDSQGSFRQYNPTFGQYTAAQLKRRMQLALKLMF